MNHEPQRRIEDKRSNEHVHWKDADGDRQLGASSIVYMARSRRSEGDEWTEIKTQENLAALQDNPEQFEVRTLFTVPVDLLSRAPISAVAAARAALDKLEARISSASKLTGAASPVAAATEQATDYVLMPRRLTAENGAKGALSGEFKESIEVPCPECHDEDEGYACSTCENVGRVSQDVTVGWDTIKDIYARAVELLAAPADATEQAEGMVLYSVAIEAARRTAQTCKEATGMHKRIDEYVNPNYIVSTALSDHAATPADAGPAQAPVATTQLTDDDIDRFIIKGGVMDRAWPKQTALHEFARAIEREVLARLSKPSAPVTASELLAKEWLIDGSLLYRLENGRNCDEINVTMIGGSRDDFLRHCAATKLKSLIEADYFDQSAAQVPSIDRDNDISDVLKEARRDLAHVEMYLEEIGAPPTIRNRTIDIRSSLQNLGALKTHPAASLPATSSEADKALLDYLDAWVMENKAAGHHWFTFSFTSEKPARVQIGMEMHLKTSAAAAGGAKYD